MLAAYVYGVGLACAVLGLVLCAVALARDLRSDRAAGLSAREAYSLLYPRDRLGIDVAPVYAPIDREDHR